MIDIHSHILWDVDDGPSSMEESLEILERASHDGIHGMIATSHYKHPLYSVAFQDVEEKINLLQEELMKNNIPITLYVGHEVRLSNHIINSHQTMQYHTLAKSRYLLLELPSSTVPLYTIAIIQNLIEIGITPIIAHPERNIAILERPAILEKLVNNGAFAQITAGSITGHFGRQIQKRSLQFIQSNLVHTYGSDVHHLTKRPLLFKEGLAYLEKKKLSSKVDSFLKNNQRIINNQPLILMELEHSKM
ncbi:tyrosine-protein phosphatase [Lysinibacillus sp. PLM2]|nr:tyrosine-protein phosphatase [Lysinibacillus sp. PLM2]